MFNTIAGVAKLPIRPDVLAAARPKYRVALTYHPAIGTFRGARGAWRVASCWEVVGEPMRPVVVPWLDGRKELWMDAPRKLHKNTFVNPAKLISSNGG